MLDKAFKPVPLMQIHSKLFLKIFLWHGKTVRANSLLASSIHALEVGAIRSPLRQSYWGDETLQQQARSSSVKLFYVDRPRDLSGGDGCDNSGNRDRKIVGSIN